MEFLNRNRKLKIFRAPTKVK